MSVSESVRNYRRRAGWSQEQLAEQADLSASVVRKVEQGGNARVETLHALARALGVTTSALFESGAPEPVQQDEGDSVRLMELRRALMPPVWLTESDAGLPETVDLAALQRQIDDHHTLYHADRYDSVAKALPGILRDAEAAVTLAEGDEARQKAVTVRARAFMLTGKYLTQVRRYDLAYHAHSQGIRDAKEAGDTLLAAVGINGLGWLLLREDRFDECEALSAKTASEIEPRLSNASPGHLAIWGELCQRIAAAAMRNNRPDVVQEARRMAGTAASALDTEYTNYREHWATFGPVTVEVKKIEDLSLVGDARGVLRRADDGIVGRKALRRWGRPSSNSWDRHRLDIARAHTLLGSHQDAMDELTRVRQTSPEWLKHQKMSRYIIDDILAHRKRTLTRDMREMASYLGVAG